jgi:hypothetical protein
MVIIDVQFVTGLHEDYAGTEPFGLADLGSGTNSVAFCLIAGGYAAGRIR